jgi:hypothetical protein
LPAAPRVFPRQAHARPVERGAAMSSPVLAPVPQQHEDGDELDLPPIYILRHRHVKAALESAARAPTRALSADGGGGGDGGGAEGGRGMTLWIHCSTLGIEENCFAQLDNALRKRVTRVLVRPDPVGGGGGAFLPMEAAVLGMVIRKLDAYESDLLDLIRGFAMHDINEMHRVGQCAFTRCSALREVVLPRSITDIHSCAFTECDKLSEVALPDSLTRICSRAFFHCAMLREVALPGLLAFIEHGAFEGCVALETVTMPPSLSHVGHDAFKDCHRLREVTMSDTTITHVWTSTFCGCCDLTMVILPKSLMRIAYSAFYNCYQLSGLVLPDSLTHIDNFAFCGCAALEELKLPNALTFVGHCAFKGCTALERVSMPDVRPFIAKSAFEDTPITMKPV